MNKKKGKTHTETKTIYLLSFKILTLYGPQIKALQKNNKNTNNNSDNNNQTKMHFRRTVC